MKIKNFITFLSIVLVVVLMSSCKEEINIQGCIDPASLSFNPAANEDDGSCMYERDLLLGNYAGINNCPNDTIFSGLDVTLNVNKDLKENDGVEVFYTVNVDGESATWFVFEGTVSGNEITFLDNPQRSLTDITFRGIPYGNAPVSATGKGTVEGDVLNIPFFSINIYEGDERVAGLNCGFEGKR